MLIFGLLNKYMKIIVRKLYEFTYKMALPCSATFLSFRVLWPALSRFLTDVLKVFVFYTQTAPDPSKNGTKRPLSASLPLRGLPVLRIIWFFTCRLLLLRKRRGSGAHSLMPSFHRCPKHICFSISNGGEVPQTLLFTASGGALLPRNSSGLSASTVSCTNSASRTGRRSRTKFCARYTSYESYEQSEL